MNASSISLRDLEYLVAVAKHMHFGKAAEACHVSQPALSTQIQKVEEFLGVKIFERNNRRVQLTPLGNDIVQQGRRVLEEAKKIVDLALSRKEPLNGSF